MSDFESLSDEEFNGHLCETVGLLDQMVRSLGYETVPDYRKQLVELDCLCLERVLPVGYAYIRVPYHEEKE